MNDLILGYHSDKYPEMQKKIKKVKLYLWISIPVAIAIMVLSFIRNDESVLGFTLLASTLLTISILMFVFNRKFYNNFIYLLLIALIGAIFKINHLPGAHTILTFSFLLSTIGFWFNSMISLSLIKDNKFLRLFGFFINLILSICFLGGLFKMQHWPGGTAMIYFGTILFLLSILALVFTLPNSNYLKWTRFHKNYFYRAILIPMAFIFIASIQLFIFPDAKKIVAFDSNNWNMEQIEYLEKEGLN